FEKSSNFVFVRKNVEALLPEPCLADAGTLTIDANPVELVGGIATLSATPNGDRLIPIDFELIYILTSGDDVVVRTFASLPVFNVTQSGFYTLHTLVAELNDISAEQYFEASGIIIGQTTGAEILDMIQEQGVCADFDLLGASVEVLGEQGCVADAGILFPTATEVPVQLFTIVAANHIVPPTVPLDFEVIYLLATANDGVLVQSGDNPTFVVNEVNTYTILTLITESSDPLSPDYFDPSTIDLGTMTIQELADQLDQLNICIDFDALGASIIVVDPSDATVRSEELKAEVSAEITAITLYPNPARNFLNIRFSKQNLASASQLVVSDVSGRQISSHSLAATLDREVITIDLAHLPPGWYALTWSFENQIRTKRFYKY
ncbi:MAG: T9SS type A sorting domain-containing protein, partial [Bacteroidota bacterium]